MTPSSSVWSCYVTEIVLTCRISSWFISSRNFSSMWEDHVIQLKAQEKASKSTLSLFCQITISNPTNLFPCLDFAQFGWKKTQCNNKAFWILGKLIMVPIESRYVRTFSGYLETTFCCAHISRNQKVKQTKNNNDIVCRHFNSFLRFFSW